MQCLEVPEKVPSFNLAKVLKIIENCPIRWTVVVIRQLVLGI